MLIFATPLTDLLRKKCLCVDTSSNDCIWNPQICSHYHHVLRLPRFDRPFDLRTNASATSVGAVLLKDKYPLAYFNKMLNSRLQATSDTHAKYMLLLKLCGIGGNACYAGNLWFIPIIKVCALWCIKPFKLRNIINSWPNFVALTLMYCTSLVTTTNQWMLYLACMEMTNPRWFPWSLPGPYLPYGKLSRAPTNDPIFISLSDTIHNQPFDHPDHSIRDNMVLLKGRLVVHGNSALQQQLISEFHNSHVGGHAGIRHTCNRIACNFFWPTLKQAVRDLVNACRTYQLVKPFNKASQGLVQPLPIAGKI